MVQRMLTAPDIRRSRRSLMLSGLADIPDRAHIFEHRFVALDILPGASRSDAAENAERNILPFHSCTKCRSVCADCLIAGIFATAMGSLSTALNALATSFTRDWYEPYVNRNATSGAELCAPSVGPRSGSPILMIVVASTTSYLVIVHPNVRIIPIVLGIFGYTYGSLLGVFLCGMFTKKRGNNRGKYHRHDCRLHRRRHLERICLTASPGFSEQPLTRNRAGLPVMEFPWWICFGTIVTFFVATLFRTSREHHPGAA